jgi:L-aspartate oxidase
LGGNKTVPSSVIIVGGGLAGLFTALKLAPRPVTVLAAAPLGAGASSAWAQGGIAAAIAEGDTAEQHTRDTVIAGAGIVDEAIALGMAREAGDRVRDLLSYGVPFDRDLEGRLIQSREAAHSTHRIVRVKGDRAGAAIMAALIEAVRKTPSITVHEHIRISSERRCPRNRRHWSSLCSDHQSG